MLLCPEQLQRFNTLRGIFMTNCDIAIIGGDSRTAYMAPYLAGKGFRVACYSTADISCSKSQRSKIHNAEGLRECIDSAPIIVCGIPFSKGECIYCEEGKDNAEITISEFQRCIHRHQTIFAGVIPESFKSTCEEREIYCHDFMLDEPMSISNAISTAEGAILEALLHKNTTLHKSDCLVLGFGRCGKMLADRLKGLHACVTVCTREENELALASALGFETLHLSKLQQNICRYEYLFNTIPACILNRCCLERMSKNGLIIDIASNHTGADYEAAKQLGIKLYFCPGLPGKYAGESCAIQLSEYVIRHSPADTRRTT